MLKYNEEVRAAILKRGIDQAVEVVVKQLKKYFPKRRSARTA
jgi:hypothetical protein